MLDGRLQKYSITRAIDDNGPNHIDFLGYPVSSLALRTSIKCQEIF